MIAPDQSSGSPDPVETLNLEKRQGMESIADIQREELINTAFTAVKLFWDRQEATFGEIASAGYPQDAVYEYFVLPSSTGFPFQEEEPVEALSLLVVPELDDDSDKKDESNNDETDDVQPDQSKMLIYVPVPEGTVFDESLDSDALPKPSRIAIEMTSPNGSVINYEIDLTGTSPFVNALDSGEEAVEWDLIDDEREAGLFEPDNNKRKRRIKIDVELIPKIHKNMIDWKAKPQRSIPVSDMTWQRPPRWDEL